MADNKRWFKVWTSILSDPDFDDLPNEIIGIWTKLGALVAKHGEKGKITVTNTQLEKRTGCSKSELESAKMRLAQINVAIESHDNATTSVIFANWLKYQVDSTGYERLKRWREKQDDNGVKKKKKIKKKILISAKKTAPEGGYEKAFIAFWEVYPKRKDKAKALEAWKKIDFANGTFKAILLAVEAHKKTQQWQDVQYIPFPAKWLNNRRWEDEVEEVKKLTDWEKPL